jgi:hypothetical protein
MPTFRTRVLQARVNATGLPVPAEALDELGAGKRPAVVVTVAGYVYRTTVGTMGGQQLLPLSAAHRAASGIAADDEVEVAIEVDTAPREGGLRGERSRHLLGEDGPARGRPPRGGGGCVRRGARPRAGVRRALLQPSARPRGSDRGGEDRRDARPPRREGAGGAAGLRPVARSRPHRIVRPSADPAPAGRRSRTRARGRPRRGWSSGSPGPGRS